MKSYKYIVSIISLNLLAFGVLFKMLYFPFAGLLFTFSMAAFCFVALPILLFSDVKKNNNLLLNSSIYFSLLLNLMGLLFKVQHWPGANILLLIGIPLPFVFFLPVFISYLRKKDIKNAKSFIAVFMLLLLVSVFNLERAVTSSKKTHDDLIKASAQTSLIAEAQKNRNTFLYKEADNARKKVANITSKIYSEMQLLNVYLEQINEYSSAETTWDENCKKITKNIEINLKELFKTAENVSIQNENSIQLFKTIKQDFEVIFRFELAFIYDTQYSVTKYNLAALFSDITLYEYYLLSSI